MARRPRGDSDGVWHHVMNRGLAKRSMFEGGADVRAFMSFLARAVRRGEIELHSWCVLTTHFHLLVRSPGGELSNAMQRIQNGYVRRFNRRQRRDGSLARGRFVSKVVDTHAYRCMVVRYIDENPVRAGLCSDARDYPWCSAHQYARPHGPRWLARDWVESWAAELAGRGSFDPSCYPGSVGPVARESLARLVERRLDGRGGRAGRDDLDSLLAMATPSVRRWLRQKARLADGVVSSEPCLAEADVSDAVQGMMEMQGGWRVLHRRRATNGWEVLHVGLLRQLACASFASIAVRAGVSAVQAKRLWERHCHLMAEDDGYADVAARVVRGSVRAASAAWGILPPT